jgi:hypothetical protein
MADTQSARRADDPAIQAYLLPTVRELHAAFDLGFRLYCAASQRHVKNKSRQQAFLTLVSTARMERDKLTSELRDRGGLPCLVWDRP